MTLLAPQDRTPSWHFWWSDDEGDLPDQIELPLIIHRTNIERAELLCRDPDKQIQARLDRLSAEDPGGDEMIELDAAGVVNDFPLSMHGQLGPASALSFGRGLRADLRVRWGRLTAALAGEIHELASLQGPDLHLVVTSPVSRPLLDALGMQEIRDGPMSLDARRIGKITGLFPCCPEYGRSWRSGQSWSS